MELLLPSLPTWAQGIIAFITSPTGTALLGFFVPIFAAKWPAIGKLLYTLLGMIGVKIPETISDATYKNLGMEKHEETPQDAETRTAVTLLESAKDEICNGRCDAAAGIVQIVSNKLQASASGVAFNATKAQ